MGFDLICFGGGAFEDLDFLLADEAPAEAFRGGILLPLATFAFLGPDVGAMKSVRRYGPRENLPYAARGMLGVEVLPDHRNIAEFLFFDEEQGSTNRKRYSGKAISHVHWGAPP